MDGRSTPRTGYSADVLLFLACVDPDSRPARDRALDTDETVGTDDTAVGPEQLGTAPEPPDESDAVFDTFNVHTIALEMPAADWADVQYNPGAEAWHTATFSWDGEVVADVGVRAFGQGSVVAGKPPLKIDFDRTIDGQEWRGLEQIKLDSSTQDAGFLNEAVGTAVLRAMDLPAARSGWANVTVNGAHVGLFVVLESIDDGFVKRWFGHDDGALYSIGTWRYGQGLNPITWGTVADWYEPQTSVGGDGSEIVAAIEVLASGSDADVRAAIDVDRFTRIAVARAAIGAIDAFAADGNNFYLYDDHGVLAPIAWDLDADLGYPYYFDNALSMGLEEPWLWSHARYNPVTGAVYSDPVHTRAVAMGWDIDGYLAELLAGPLEWEALDAEVARQAAVIHDSACADTYHSCASFEHRVVDLRFFLHSRLATLAGGEVAECRASRTPTVVSGTALVDSTRWAPGFMVGGEHHCNGLSVTAPTTVSIRVDAGTLSGAVGVHDQNMNPCAGDTFSIAQSGVTLWEGSAAAYAPAVPFAVAVGEGVVELTAVGAGAGCDAAVWVDLRVGE